MDERIRKLRGTRKLFACAALVVPAISLAEEPISSSFLRARLTSGFGAGTNRGGTFFGTSQTKRERSTASPAAPREPCEPCEISMRVAPPQVAKSSSQLTHPIRAARQLTADHALPLPQSATDFAAMIRRVDPQTQAIVDRSRSSKVFELRAPFEIRSVQIETAPAVRRILLGEYDPNRALEFDSQAIVRLADPVVENSLDGAKQVETNEKDRQHKCLNSDDFKLHLSPKMTDDRLGMIEAESVGQGVPKNSSTLALMQALAAPEVSGLIETLPKIEAEKKTEADDAFDEIIQWDLLLSE
ncbi:MAG: hypothetical protein VYA84_08145 [Planctomycetota bacterium]|nr:hypothetical protein [Planctomycetota bacterium]